MGGISKTTRRSRVLEEVMQLACEYNDEVIIKEVLKEGVLGSIDGRTAQNGPKSVESDHWEVDDAVECLWKFVGIACENKRAKLVVKVIENLNFGKILLHSSENEERSFLGKLRISVLGRYLRQQGIVMTNGLSESILRESRNLNINATFQHVDHDQDEVHKTWNRLKSNKEIVPKYLQTLGQRDVWWSCYDDYFTELFQQYALIFCSFHNSAVLRRIEVYCLLLLLLNAAASTGLRLSGTGNSEHRKSVIKQITLSSGDIERNPGPFYFNNWLRYMYKFLVRKVYNIDKDVNIPWKKLNLPDPNNSKFNKDHAPDLFTEELLQASETLIPSTHTEEFRILRTYIESGQEPDMKHLERIENIRKILVKGQELVEDLKKLSSDDKIQISELSSILEMQFFNHILAEDDLSNNGEWSETLRNSLVSPLQQSLHSVGDDTSETNQGVLQETVGECADPKSDSGGTVSCSGEGEEDTNMTDRDQVTSDDHAASASVYCGPSKDCQTLPDALVNFILDHRNDLPFPMQTVSVHQYQAVPSALQSTLQTSLTTADQMTRAENSSVPVRTLETTGKDNWEKFGTGMMKLLYQTSPDIIPHMLQTVMELSQKYITEDIGHPVPVELATEDCLQDSDTCNVQTDEEFKEIWSKCLQAADKNFPNFSDSAEDITVCRKRRTNNTNTDLNQTGAKMRKCH